MRNKPEKHVGKVIAIQYAQGDEHPRLHIDSEGYLSIGNPDGYAIVNPELMKKIHRTLATGDVVECQVRNTPDGIMELTNFGIVQQYEPIQGEVRKLQIHHWDGQFGNLGIAGAQPGQIDMSDTDWELLHQGDYVFNLTWEGMTGGVSSIVRLGNTYYYDEDSGVFGPFSSLREALRWSEMDTLNPATTSIECSEMDSETIAGMLLPSPYKDEPSFSFEINGEEWEVDEQGTLKRSD